MAHTFGNVIQFRNQGIGEFSVNYLKSRVFACELCVLLTCLLCSAVDVCTRFVEWSSVLMIHVCMC